MEDKQKDPRQEEPRRPDYQPPEVTTYTEQDILEEMGPAQTMFSTVGNTPWG